MKNIMPPINTPDNAFHDGNPATGEQGTIVPGKWLNNSQGATRNIQQELISVLTEAAIEIDENKTNQLLLAILNLISTRSPDLPVASTLQKGIVQLSSLTNSTSEMLAATPKAVKAVLDASLPIGGTAKAAEKLATARKISGVDFDGSKDITLPFINTTDTNIQLDGALTAVGDIRAGRLLSKSDLIAGEGRAEGHATLAVDGNVHGTAWGGALSSHLTNRFNDYGVYALGRGAQVAMGSPLYNMMSPAGTFLTGVTVNGNGQTQVVYYRGLFMQRPAGGWVQMGGDIG
ncbi:TPA: phage tail protein [Yersinia enterocolitica]